MVRRRLSNSLFLGGIALIVLAGVLTLPRLARYAETQLYTSRIPTAPVLSTAEVQLNTPNVLLPANDGDQSTPLPMVPSSTPTPAAAVATAPDTPRLTPSSTSTPNHPATPTAVWSGTAPTSLSIPSIGLEAAVVPIGWKTTTVNGQSQAIWDVPDRRRIGWHNTSVPLGVAGNTVLNGHNTSGGEVFRDLYKVELGAQIFADGVDGETYVYRVDQKYILREAGQPLSVRLENARYIQAMPDERLTLVTCHPYGSLANRLVLIAFPVVETILDRGGAN